MLMNETIDTIISVAVKNGVALDKNFNQAYLASHSFYEGPRALAEKTVEDMRRLCYWGVNCGFDNALKSALAKLSDIVASLTAVESGQIKELAKCEMQRNKILDTVRETSYPIPNDLRNVVRKYIDSSVEAIDTITELNTDGEIFSTIDEKQIKLMAESKQKLGEISFSLMKLMDVSSTSAKGKADKVIELLKAWREDCTYFMCTSRSLKYLDEAKAAVDEWASLNITPSKRDKIRELPVYKRDEMAVIAESKGSLEVLSTFNARIASERAELEKRRAELNAEKSKLNDVRFELAETLKKKEQIPMEIMNGRNPEEANREFVALKNRAEELKSEISRMERGGRLQVKAEDIKNKERIIEDINYVCEQLKDNQGDIVFLAKVINNVNFNSLVAVMTGRKANMEQALDSLRQIRARVETKFDSSRIARDQLELEGKVAAQIFESVIPETEETEISKTEDVLDPELAALLNKMKTENKGEIKTETEEEVRRIVPLGDDDK